jgi:hypothetical protein
MADLDYRIDANDTRLKLALDQLPKKLQLALREKIRALTNQTLRLVVAREPVKTGRLREHTHAYVDVNEVKQYVRGRVRILPVQQGVNRTAAAFGALEYGAPGKSGRRSGRVVVQGYRRGGVLVRSYNRRPPTIHARRFLRSSASVMLPKARAELGLLLGKFSRDALK